MNFNTPLGVGVTGATFLAERLRALDESSLTDDEMRVLMDIHRMVGDGLGKISRLMLRLKSLKAVASTAEMVTCDVASRIRDIMKAHTGRKSTTPAAFSVICDSRLKFSAPRGVLETLLDPLAENALHHSLPRVGSSAFIMTIEVEASEEELVVDFRDNGPGVADMETLFDAYHFTFRDSGLGGMESICFTNT